MRLTLQTDYALRMLLYAGTAGNRLSSVGEIAESYGISRNHLVKVAHRLGQLGFLETVRGHAGGVRLGQAPGQIVIGEVVRRMEPDFDIVECFDRDTSSCVIDRACGMKSALFEAQRAFLQVLDRFTLADFLQHPDGLVRLLGHTR